MENVTVPPVRREARHVQRALRMLQQGCALAGRHIQKMDLAALADRRCQRGASCDPVTTPPAGRRIAQIFFGTPPAAGTE